MWHLQNASFVQTAQRHKDFSFIFINDTEKQQILTFKTLNHQVFLLFYLKNDWTDSSIIKIVGNLFLY